MKATYKKLPASLCMVASRETYEDRIAIDWCDGPVPCRLFLVTLTRAITGKRPAVSLHYVIAPDESEAISQCECLAFPEMEGSILDEAERTVLTATAFPVPVMVRGWGVQTF
jgi:hypothetical protein